VERAGERALERAGERALERAGERALERAGERALERAGERDRNATHQKQCCPPVCSVPITMRGGSVPITVKLCGVAAALSCKMQQRARCWRACVGFGAAGCQLHPMSVAELQA
jgi:hypothetical protein